MYLVVCLCQVDSSQWHFPDMKLFSSDWLKSFLIQNVFGFLCHQSQYLHLTSKSRLFILLIEFHYFAVSLAEYSLEVGLKTFTGPSKVISGCCRVLFPVEIFYYLWVVFLFEKGF